MSSYEHGKERMTGWAKGRFRRGSTCLDVGACDGNWYKRLGNYLTMDAVEINPHNIDLYGLKDKYRHVWCSDIADFEYDWYDLIIFGDVIEHMTVEQAQKVLEYAKPRCKDMIVAVPFLYSQGALYGNEYEIHIQDDLTPDLFSQRYPGFQIIEWPVPNYAYYIKAEE